MPSPIRVLYVDDEPSLLTLSKRFLEKDGAFVVDTLTSASEALELLNTEQYDIIISDYQMPDIDGIEFLKKLKTSGNTTPFIIFTGKGREEVVIEAINSGADFYLQKGGEPKAQFTELAHKIKTAVSRQRTEKQARDAERRLYDIINFLPDATFAIDNEGYVIAWNKAIEEMTGVAAPDMLGKGNYEYAIPFYEVRRPILIDLVSIPDEELTRGTYAIVKKEGDILIAETPLPRPLGKNSVLLGKASLLYNNQGEVTGAIESIRDITEQKRAELELIRKSDELNASYEQIAAAEEEMRAQLNELKQNQQTIQENEEKYRTLIEHCMDAVFIAQDGCIAAVNPAFISMTGYSEEELIGQPLTMPIAPEDRETVLTRHRRRLAGHQEPDTYEFSMVHKDQKTRIRVVMSVGSGKYQGRSATIGTIHDVTMERDREDLLRESEMRFHQLSDATDDGLVMHKQGIIQEANTRACNLFGYSHDDVIGMNVLDLTAPGSKDIVREKMQRLSEEPYEMEGLKKDGTRFFGTFHSHNLIFKNQQIRLTSVRDITESRKSEEALKHQSKTLSILNGIIVTANKADNLPDLLSSILEESLRLLDFDAGGIYVVNPATRTADVVQSKNLPPEFLAKIQTVPIDKSPYNTPFIRKEPIFTENYEKLNPDLSKKFGFQSAAIIPLLAKGVAIGAMNITSTRRYVISEEEKQTLISIGSELGSTLKRMIAEEDAKKASKNLEALFNSIDEMVFVLDMQGTILAVNDTVQKRLLYTSEELSGMNVLLLHVPERRDEALHIVQGMIAGTIDSCPVPVVAKDGTCIEVETKVTRALWNNQDVLIGVSRDITERACAEEALRESESRYRLLADNATDVIWTLDLNGSFTYVSPSVLHLRGYTVEEVMQQPFNEVISEGSIAVVQETIERTLEEAKSGIIPAPTVTEVEQPCKDGSSVWTEVVSRLLVDATGKPTEFIGVSRNITRRKLMEKALRESKERFHSLFTNMIDGAVLHELIYNDQGIPEDYVIIETNPTFELQLGISRDMAIGKTSREVYGVSEPPYFEIYSRVALTGEPEIFETYFPPLKKHFVVSVYSPYKGSFATIFEDITERKRSEEAVHLANKKLNLLTSITRHDINNQLTVLQGYLVILEKKQSDPALKEYFQKACASSQRISSMIRFTKEYEQIGVNAPIWQDCRTIVEIAAKDAPLGKVAIKNDFPAGIEVFADPLIVKVFYNLMDNAIRYGKKITTIRFTVDERDGDRVLVCEDDGVGIPADDKERIFERGYGKNTGLGLALSREVIDITGITIRETGEPGKGARFEMLVPKGMYR